ncbi:HlyD family efflux transporter periplasmic adaptor subunit [Runella sp.]|uniref:HlyD family secretion protein n=1 Tax=Runella sp. TaxID=1960881 RepID=UPI003016308D
MSLHNNQISTPPLGVGGLEGSFEELRNEELQEVLSHTPPWALRWGNTLFLLILLGMMALAWVIKYPEIVTVSFCLTSDDAPKPVVAKSTGRLVKLWVKENQQVQQGQTLAYLESTASHQEVLRLGQALEKLAILVKIGRFEVISSFKAGDFQKLGELQADYQTFMQPFTETATLFANGYLDKKRNFLNDELANLKKNNEQLLDQLDIQKKEFKLIEKEFEMHQKLFQEKVIAPVEYNREERNYLAKQLPLKQLDMTLTNNAAAQTQKQKELAELDKQANDQKAKCAQALSTLRAAVGTWKTRFVLVSPKDGQVFFASLWQEGQSIKNDEILFYVGSSQKSFFGEARIPQRNSGKVKEGQRVLVKFQSYPFEQFGIVEGNIQNIAAVPSSDSTFRAVVGLPKGLQTSSRKTLPFKNGLNATAEIVTEDLSIAERMFYEVRKMLR